MVHCWLDTDGDGVCDQNEIMDVKMLQHVIMIETATESGECTYAILYYDCDSNCLNDTDEDGVCDELEIMGCHRCFSM